MPLSSRDRHAAHRSGLNVSNEERRNFGLHGSNPSQKFLRSSLVQMTTGFLATSQTVYWVFLGKTEKALNVTKVWFDVTVAGAGTVLNEAALATSPATPNGAGQLLTVIAASSTLTSNLTTGLKSNTTDFNKTVNPTTNLWAGVRFAMGTTQPTLTALTLDESEGNILVTIGDAVVLAAGQTLTGTLVAQGVAAQGPALRVQVS